jgi:PPOX class probable F420-dependent enzyme
VDLIESGPVAHLATVNPDGSPQLTVVWGALVGEEIWVASLSPRQKLRNVEREPRVAVTWESQESDALGMRYYLGINGRARVTQGGAREFLRELAPRFVKPGIVFPRGATGPPGYIMRITVDRWRGHGPWAESG